MNSRSNDGVFTTQMENLVWTASPTVRVYLHAFVSGHIRIRSSVGVSQTTEVSGSQKIVGDGNQLTAAYGVSGAISNDGGSFFLYHSGFHDYTIEGPGDRVFVQQRPNTWTGLTSNGFADIQLLPNGADQPTYGCNGSMSLCYYGGPSVFGLGDGTAELWSSVAPYEDRIKHHCWRPVFDPNNSETGFTSCGSDVLLTEASPPVRAMPSPYSVNRINPFYLRLGPSNLLYSSSNEEHPSTYLDMSIVVTSVQ